MKYLDVINDLGLRPFFFELISKNFMIGLTEVHKVNYADRLRYQKEYYEALVNLSNKLNGKVKEDEISSLIKEGTLYYLGSIGKFGVRFDGLDLSAN
jgi:hypothetical protein